MKRGSNQFISRTIWHLTFVRMKLGRRPFCRCCSMNSWAAIRCSTERNRNTNRNCFCPTLNRACVTNLAASLPGSATSTRTRPRPDCSRSKDREIFELKRWVCKSFYSVWQRWKVTELSINRANQSSRRLLNYYHLGGSEYIFDE